MADSGIVIAGHDRSNQLIDATGVRRSNQTFLRPRVDLGGVAEGSSFLGSFGGLIAQEETPVPNMQLAFQYNINDVYVRATTANGGTVTQATGMAILQTSVNPAGSAILASVGAARYSPGQGQTVRFTAIFPVGVAASHVEAGIGDTQDALTFGYDGVTFGVFRTRGGVADFIPQTAWNVDRMDGTGPSGQVLNPQAGNVYQIRFQWLGFGPIRYYVEDKATGLPQLVHVIQYANSNVLPSIFNPSLPLHAHVLNAGNATNLTLRIASMGVYAEGPYNSSGGRFSVGNRKIAIGAVETNILTIRCDALVFGGQANRGRIHFDAMSVAISGGADSQVRVIRNATLGGVPAFAALDAARSIVSVDVAGTTVAGGREIRRVASTGNFQETQDLANLEVRIAPGDTLTFSAMSFGANVSANVCPAWNEEL